MATTKTPPSGYSITLKGPGHTFERTIEEDLANRIINLVMTGGASPSTTNNASNTGAKITTSLGELNPKQFMSQKRPANNYERVACLAYYLSNHQNKPKFKTADITALNTAAAGQPLSNASVFVRDAASKYGYLSAAGGGAKQLTVLGEQVVEALPDREKVKSPSGNITRDCKVFGA
jgi:hypothetical protein